MKMTQKVNEESSGYCRSLKGSYDTPLFNPSFNEKEVVKTCLSQPKFLI